MPDLLDLTALRGTGPQPGEVIMAETSTPLPEASVIHENPAVVSQLVEMGFPADGCRRAVHLTQNAGLEAAMAWVMEHMEDPDFAAPFPPPASGVRPTDAVTISEENTAMVMSMGFSLEQAQVALRHTDNNVERAVEWIFSHPDGEDDSTPGARSKPESREDAAQAGLSDGVPR
jgi:ubiquitin carboxyl-terminal hydrolase 5/13